MLTEQNKIFSYCSNQKNNEFYTPKIKCFRQDLIMYQAKPGTLYIDQIGLKIIEICLALTLSTGVKGMHSYPQENSLLQLKANRTSEVAGLSQQPPQDQVQGSNYQKSRLSQISLWDQAPVRDLQGSSI